MTIEIHGFCDERFQTLKDAFAQNFEAGLEVGASLAATHKGKFVVDLWAGHADFARTRPWQKDTIVVVFSSTKLPLTIAFLMLIDRGLVGLDAPVAQYSPEFGVGGKDRVTIGDVLTYRSGVPGFDPPIAFDDLRDWNLAVHNIAAQTHWFAGAQTPCYHPMTYGYILGEVLRRVTGRMPTEFFRTEVAEKAAIDFQLSLSDERDRLRVAEVGYLVPPGNPTDLLPNPVAKRVFDSYGVGDWSTWEHQRAEIPAANGYANGRSIARVCSILAMNGSLDGVTYLSPKTVEEMSSEQFAGDDLFMGPVRRGLCVFLDTLMFPAPTPTSFTWGGYGGSFEIVDRATDFACGYAMNNLILPDSFEVVDPRQTRLWNALGAIMREL